MMYAVEVIGGGRYDGTRFLYTHSVVPSHGALIEGPNQRLFEVDDVDVRSRRIEVREPSQEIVK